MRHRTIEFDESITGLPEFRWVVEVSVRCPKCGNEATPGRIGDGSIAINCQSCEFGASHKGINANAVIVSVLEHALKLTRRTLE